MVRALTRADSRAGVSVAARAGKVRMAVVSVLSRAGRTGASGEDPPPLPDAGPDMHGGEDGGESRRQGEVALADGDGSAEGQNQGDVEAENAPVDEPQHRQQGREQRPDGQSAQERGGDEALQR